MPEGVYPEVGARIMDLQEPTNKMSTTGGTPQGTVKLLDDAGRDPEEVQLGGDRLRLARCAAATTSPASRT